ncbi:MAG: MCE family protein [Chlorobia bacterium]|nr:MCE family protein [Fimbriimonadaceae bacterium]
MQGAAKVGILVVIFAVLFYGAYMVLGQNLLGESKSTYYAEFADAGGMTSGSQVQIAGVKVGTVDSVDLKSPTLARLTLKIDKTVNIPSGSTALIPTSLIGLGDKAVLIVPPKQSSGFLTAGSTLKGVRTGALDGILPNPEATVAELNRTLVATRKLLENQQLQTKLVTLLDSSNKTAAEFGKLAGRMDTILAQGNPKIQRALNEAALTMSEVRKGTTMLTQIIKDGRYQKEALAMLEKLNQAAEGANKIISDVQALTGDPDLKASLSKTTKNVATMTDSGVEIAKSSEKIAKDGEKISANAIVMSEKVIEIETKASALLDEVKVAIDNIKGFFQKTGGKVTVPKIEATLDLMRKGEPNRFQTDVGVKIDLKDYDIHVGLWDAFETNRITAQLARPFSPNGEYRYGIYASKPGVGVDYRVAPSLYLRGDLFDINRPRFDLRARYEFGKGFYGWIGMDSIFNKNAPMIGLGIRN